MQKKGQVGLQNFLDPKENYIQYTTLEPISMVRFVGLKERLKGFRIEV